jgi:glycerophosphoryl diester phosphodiesterase
MKKDKRNIIIFIVVLCICIWINNSSLLVKQESTTPKLLAHRGLAQTFDLENVKWDTNTAEIIHKPEHPYLENTIESMKVAFSYDADVVEFDVKLTKDNQLAIFHDFVLEYRTNGEGEVSKYTMEELKKLDIGYGYTADKGETYPFRGKGTGMMPSIEEVFKAFPDKEILIHLKTDDIKTGEVLWEYLKEMDKDRQSQITVYGDNPPIQYLREQSESLRVMSGKMMKRALISYELVGWTGYIPKELKNTEIHLPVNYAKLLWGWSNKFIQRMDKVNTRVVLVNGNGGFSEGFDDKESLENLPKNFSGYIWTNRIDKISEVYKSK